MSDPMIAKNIGILGGGQLGRYLALSAQKLRLNVILYTDDGNSPATLFADEVLTGSYDDIEKISSFAQKCDVVISEFENIAIDCFQKIEDITTLSPSLNLIEKAQHRFLEKKLFQKLNIPTTTFFHIKNEQDFLECKDQIPIPCILKTCRMGYDGKGQILVKNKKDLETAYQQLADQGEIIAEKQLFFSKEISVILTRGYDGQTVHLPIGENEHDNGILHHCIIPAEIPDLIEKRAIDYTKKIAEELSIIGTFCVEYFVLPQGQVVANEIAPRVHNSGHYSLNSSNISQFDLAVRAAAGLKLPDETVTQPCAMMNILGGPYFDERLEYLMNKHPNCAFHDYGKASAKDGRKMGHVTYLAEETNMSQHQYLKILKNKIKDLDHDFYHTEFESEEKSKCL